MFLLNIGVNGVVGYVGGVFVGDDGTLSVIFVEGLVLVLVIIILMFI